MLKPLLFLVISRFTPLISQCVVYRNISTYSACLIVSTFLCCFEFRIGRGKCWTAMSQFATTRGYIRSWICKVGALTMIYPNKVEAKHWYLNYSNQHGREPRLHHCAWIFGLNWEPKKAQSWRPTSPMAREPIGSQWLRTQSLPPRNSQKPW